MAILKKNQGTRQCRVLWFGCGSSEARYFFFVLLYVALAAPFSDYAGKPRKIHNVSTRAISLICTGKERHLYAIAFGKPYDDKCAPLNLRGAHYYLPRGGRRTTRCYWADVLLLEVESELLDESDVEVELSSPRIFTGVNDVVTESCSCSASSSETPVMVQEKLTPEDD